MAPKDAGEKKKKIVAMLVAKKLRFNFLQIEKTNTALAVCPKIIITWLSVGNKAIFKPNKHPNK